MCVCVCACFSYDCLSTPGFPMPSRETLTTKCSGTACWWMCTGFESTGFAASFGRACKKEVGGYVSQSVSVQGEGSMGQDTGSKADGPHHNPPFLLDSRQSSAERRCVSSSVTGQCSSSAKSAGEQRLARTCLARLALCPAAGYTAQRGQV